MWGLCSVSQQEPDSWNIKELLLIKDIRYLNLVNLTLFLQVAKCKSWGLLLLLLHAP